VARFSIDAFRASSQIQPVDNMKFLNHFPIINTSETTRRDVCASVYFFEDEKSEDKESGNLPHPC
jgi:hypothetical protein